MRHAHLFAEVYNTPLMVHAGRAEMIEAAFRSLLTGEQIPQPAAALAYQDSEDRNYRVTEGGVAVLPIVGTLSHRASLFGDSGAIRSYRSLNARLAEAMADRDVRGVMLDMETPGGSVAGLFQLTDLIRGASKPIWTHANEYAYSAGMAIAAATSRIIGARTSDVGSIGVIAMLVDQTEFDKKLGVKVTPVYAGARKADYNPHLPVNADALARLQASVNELYDAFVAHVAGNRPMTEQQVRETEAGTFSAGEAQRIGLLDDIMNFEDAVLELEAHVRAGSRVVVPLASAGKSARGETMSQDNQAQATFTQAELDAAKNDGWFNGLAEGRTKGAQDERERIAAIINHPEAEGRDALAKSFAFETDMTAETAGKLMAKSPKAAPEKATANAFDRVVGAYNPDVGPAGEAPAADTVKAHVAAILQTIQQR